MASCNTPAKTVSVVFLFSLFFSNSTYVWHMQSKNVSVAVISHWLFSVFDFWRVCVCVGGGGGVIHRYLAVEGDWRPVLARCHYSGRGGPPRAESDT